jgi:glucokinase
MLNQISEENMSCYAIGVDIGGTNTKLVLIGEDGRIHLRDSFLTPKGSQAENIVKTIIKETRVFYDRALSAGFDVEGVGFAVPQFCEGKDAVQRQTNNMQSLEGFPMYPPLRDAFGTSITIINDVSAAGVGEFRFGCGRNHERMLLMAIGTGVCTSFVTREYGLLRYSWDGCGDTGMIIVDPFGNVECSCGGRGCLEPLVSGPGIRRRALFEIERGKSTLLAKIKTEKGDLEARNVTEAASAGDLVARDIMDQVGFYLGVALTSYLHIFRPDVIVLAGGVAQAGDVLLEPARRTMNRLASRWYLDRFSGIELSALGMEGQAIGVASLILSPG